MTALKVTLSDGTALETNSLNDTSYMPLASVLLGSDGAMPDLNDPRLARNIMKNLGDPAYIKRLAYGLVSLFPAISEDLAWFDHPTKRPSFGVGMSIADLTTVTTEAAIALYGQSKPAKPKQGFQQPRRRR